MVYQAYSQKKIESGYTILQKSIQAHDPGNKWSTTNLHVHIQEPRLSNPHRYSIIRMNNKEHSFELSRSRGQYISKHFIDKEGISTTLLDNAIITDSTLVRRYRLQPERNFNYQKFYQQLLGLPMSLNHATIDSLGTVSKEVFNKTDSYKIALILKEAVFSKYWNVYISQDEYTILGIEIRFPEDTSKGERLYFTGVIHINGIKIPRIRHWYEYSDHTYSGSDIIVKTILDDN